MCVEANPKSFYLLKVNNIYLGPTGQIFGTLSVENSGDFIGDTGPTGPMGEAFYIDANGDLTVGFDEDPAGSINNYFLYDHLEFI